MQLEKITSTYGEVRVPGDKSISHRGVMLGALGDGTTEIEGFLMGGGLPVDHRLFPEHGDRD